jgi:hypothetical protein
MSFVTWSANACIRKSTGVSSLAVTDGEPVTRPDQAPGTYRLKFFRMNPTTGEHEALPNGGAAALVSRPGMPATFITAAHNIRFTQASDLVQLVDFQGNVVAEIPKDDVQSTQITSNQFDQRRVNFKDGMANDLGAIIFKNPLTAMPAQGNIQIMPGLPKPGESVSIVGAGATTSKYYSQFGNPDLSNQAPGVLRFGTNTISSVSEGNGRNGSLLEVNGTSGDFGANPGMSVSLPGDSGGSYIVRTPDGIPLLAGIVSNGYQYRDNGVGQPDYNNVKTNPEAASDYPGAVGIGVGFTGQDAFFDQVRDAGGDFEFARQNGDTESQPSAK